MPISNKKQILGFFLILFSVLIILSIVSYSAADETRLETISISEIFKKENQTSNFTTSNWLGIIGVVISGYFVRGAFGYFSLILPVLFIIFGVQMMRKKSLLGMLQLSVYLIFLMIFTSALFGMLRTTLGVDKISYSLVGTSGEYFASIFYLMLGSLGSYILLIGLVAAFSFLLVDRDIAKSFARLKLLFESFRDKFRSSIEEMKEKREEEKQLEEKRDVIRAEREKIARKKSTGKLQDETHESEHTIKDTKINRPVESEMIVEDKHKLKSDKNKEIPPETGKPDDENPLDAIIPPVKTSNKRPQIGDVIPDEVKEEETVFPVETLEDYKLPSLIFSKNRSKKKLMLFLTLN